MVYLPKAMRRNRARIQATTASPELPREPTKITFTPGPFGKILIGCWVIFWGGVFLLLLFLKPGKALTWFPAPWVLLIIVLALILTSFGYGITWLYRAGSRR